MKRSALVIPTLFLSGFAFFGYGPLQDHTEFVSARLAEDNRTVLFTVHQFAYRPATGWRAFPDGGIPRYVKDVNLIGSYDLQNHELRSLRREKNSEWQPGSGQFNIHAIYGTKALIVQGGQLRGTFKLATKYLLLDWRSGKSQELDLKSDLARHGREPGQIYLVDNAGDLVFITEPRDSAADSGSRRNETVPEIWVRTSTGRYFKAATSAHYEGTKDGEVIYWEPSTRAFMAFSIATQQTQPLPRYRTPGYQDVTHGVILSSDHRSLQAGEKIGGQWQYRALPIQAAAIH